MMSQWSHCLLRTPPFTHLSTWRWINSCLTSVFFHKKNQ
ncbi:hypothetical protein V6Z11_A06G136500 [Gossypium hirsutum]